MSTYDILTTLTLGSAEQGFCIPAKPLLALEPGVGNEPTTYALRVLSLCNQVETSGLWWTDIAVDARISRNWWGLVDRGGLTTELTTLSDIQNFCIPPAVIAPSSYKSFVSGSVIYKPLVSSLFEQYEIVQP